MKKIIILLSVLLIIKEQNGQGLYPGGTGLPTPVFTTTSAITTGGLTTTGLINMNNFGADKKYNFKEPGAIFFHLNTTLLDFTYIMHQQQTFLFAHLIMAI